MKTRIELDANFDYPDGTQRNLIKEFCLVILLGAFLSVMLLTTICHADKIDHFAAQVASDIYFALSRHKIYAILLLSVSLIAIWYPFFQLTFRNVKLAFNNLKILYFFRTRRGR